MPFDPSGNFSRMHSWQQDRDNGIRILADRHDEEDDNFGNAFNLTFLRTGTVPMTGNLVMGGNAIKLIKAGSEAAPGLSFELSNQTGIWQPNPTTIAVSSNGVKKFEVNGAGAAIFGDASVSGNTSLGGSLTITAGISAQAYYLAGNDPCVFGTLPSGDAFINFDANDYLTYGKAANAFEFLIGGAQIAYVNATGITSNANMSVTGDIWATSVHLTGSINLNGNVDVGGAVNAHSLTLTGSGNAAYITTDGGGNPIFNFDANDYMVYDRPNDSLDIMINGNMSIFKPDGSLVVPNHVIVNNAVDIGGSLHSIQTPPSGPYHIVDTGDYWRYNRSPNQFEWVIGESSRMLLDLGGLNVTGNISANSSTLYAVNAQLSGDVGAVNVTGTNGVFAGTSGGYYMTDLGTVKKLQFANGSLFQYEVANVAISCYVNNTFSGVFYPGKFQSPVLATSAAHYFNDDASYSNWNVDATDWARFSRSNNQYQFIVGNGVQSWLGAGYSWFGGELETTSTAYIGGHNGSIGGGMSVLDRAQTCIHTWTSTSPGGYNGLAFNHMGNEVGSIWVAASGLTWNPTSDIRLKKNIADCGDAGAIIDAIKVREFDWKVDDTHIRFGFIAQEIREIMPEAVRRVSMDDPEDDEEPIQGLDPMKLIPLLVKEAQALRARVDFLEKANRGRH